MTFAILSRFWSGTQDCCVSSAAGFRS